MNNKNKTRIDKKDEQSIANGPEETKFDESKQTRANIGSGSEVLERRKSEFLQKTKFSHFYQNLIPNKHYKAF